MRSQDDISSKKHNPKKTVSEIRLERQIVQDLSSPDHGIPESPASLLEYRGEPMFDKNKWEFCGAFDWPLDMQSKPVN